MLEDKKYTKRATSEYIKEDAKMKEEARKKVVEEDSSSYYLNGLYKNVVSSRYAIKTQSKSLVDQHCHEHKLPLTDSKFFCLVEGGWTKEKSAKGGGGGRAEKAAQYLNIRIKHDQMNKHNQMNEDVELQMYYRSKSYYLFLFKLVTSSKKEDWKYSFFFIRLNYN